MCLVSGTSVLMSQTNIHFLLFCFFGVEERLDPACYFNVLLCFLIGIYSLVFFGGGVGRGVFKLILNMDLS